MKHMGMDLHSLRTDVCVRNGKGVILLRQRIPTTKSELENLVIGIPGRKRVIVEESRLSDLVTRLLMGHVDEVIRCQPRFNRLISESEDKWDKTDAESLSDLLYLNRFKRVHHPRLTYGGLRQAVRGYWISSRELTRAKNRVKQCFLGGGLHEVGDGIYSVRNGSRNLKRLKEQGSCIEWAQLRHANDARDGSARNYGALRRSRKGQKGKVFLDFRSVIDEMTRSVC
ncbi:MAG: transposase [Acidobacteriia bacterium]|nr:transposase [Terriglobia bacterium]